MSDSNSNGTTWCAPHIEGRYLREAIAEIVQEDGKNWFQRVYALLEKNEIDKDARAQFYAHATAIEDCIERLRKLEAGERAAIFGVFCRHCGSTDPGCQCWNDD